MKYVFLSVMLSLAIGAMPLCANAGLVNDIPSCYKANHLSFRSKAPSRLLYVLIDQTVRLTPDLERSVISNVDRALKPGTKFVVAEFSAFSQGRYLSVLDTGVIEHPLTSSEAGNVPIIELPQIKACLTDQDAYAKALADKTLLKVMHNASSRLDNSDILSAIKSVAPAIREDSAADKVLFLVTDGLENSSVMSFYSRRGIVKVDAAKAVAIARKNALVGNLGGARVFVLGGGMMPPAKQGTREQRNGYRSPIILAHLKAFWGALFKASHAKLVEFGEPALTQPVTY